MLLTDAHILLNRSVGLVLEATHLGFSDLGLQRSTAALT